MKLNQAGIDLIKSFEKCRLQAYPDPVTKAAPWTIGWGHTGPEVHQGLTWTQEVADVQFNKDVDRVATQVRNHIIRTVSDNKFSACVCLCYNIGIGNFGGSSLLRCINNGDVDGAAIQFTRWDKAAGHEVQGLLTRRLAEQKLFQS